MKKKELREMTIVYCDYCGKELNSSYRSVEYPDGRKLDFCDNYTSTIRKTCFDKHKKEEELKRKTVNS